MTQEAPPSRRSDTTKAAILNAAREHFAASGFQGATIRAIATSAGIDPAMVMRYFGDKKKLFEAASEIDLELPDLTTLESGQIGAALVEHFLNRWEGDEALMVLLRSAVTNSEAATRIQEIFARQTVATIKQFSKEPLEKIMLRASLVASQILGLALCRYVLKLPPMVAADRNELIRRVGATVQSYIVD
jgi:AcrR family transcriptional regulator